MSLSQIVEVKLELGHRAKCRDVPSLDGHTHDWMIFVKGAESVKLEYFVEKVVFWLHDSYENPKRVLKKPPYKVEQSGYAGFMVLIDIHFRNKEEPKMVRFQYDLFLHTESMPPVNHTRLEKLTFTHPTEDFKKKLLDGGGVQLNMDDDKSKKDGAKLKPPPPSSNSQKPRDKSRIVSKGKEPPKDQSKSISKTDDMMKPKEMSKSSSSIHKQATQLKPKHHKSNSKRTEQPQHKPEKRKSTALEEEVLKKTKIVAEKGDSTQNRIKDKKQSKKSKPQNSIVPSIGLFAKESSINIKNIKKPKTDKRNVLKDSSKNSSRKEKLQKFVKTENAKPTKQSKSSKEKDVRHGSKSKLTSSERNDATKHKSKRKNSSSFSEDSSNSSSSTSSSNEDELPARKKKKSCSSLSESDSDNEDIRKEKKSKDAKHRSSMSKHTSSKRPVHKDIKKEKPVKLVELKSSSSDTREKFSSNNSRHKLKQKRRHSTKEVNKTVSGKTEMASKKVKPEGSKLNKSMPEFASSKKSEFKESSKIKEEYASSKSSHKNKKRKSESSAKIITADSGIKMTFKKPSKESLPADITTSNETIKKISAKLGKNKEKSTKSESSKLKKLDVKDQKVRDIVVKKEPDQPKKIHKSKVAISESSSDSLSDDDDTLTLQSYHLPPEKPKNLAIKREECQQDKHQPTKSPLISPVSADSEISYTSAPSPILKVENKQGNFSTTQDDFSELLENDSLLNTQNLNTLSPLPNNSTEKPTLIQTEQHSEQSNSDDEIQSNETPFNREDYKSEKEVHQQYDAEYYCSIMPPEGRYVTIERTETNKLYPHLTPQLFKELQELQQKVSELTSISRLKKIMSIVQKSGPCQKNPDDTFDFDLCALDQKTISKIQKTLKT